MPPKSRTNKPLPPPVLPQSSNIQNTKSGLDPEAEDRFELEICWCIQELEISLGNNKLQQKQAEAAMKTLNVLKSNTSSIIKKRQVMRNTFGDYRQKMAEDEKKYGKITSSLKFTPVKKEKIKKSVFIKKATNSKDLDQNSEETVNTNRGILDQESNDKPFAFNFKQPDT